MRTPPPNWLPFLDLLILLTTIKACRLSRTYSSLILTSTIACVFLFLLGSDLSDWAHYDDMDILFGWPTRGYIWRGGFLFGLIVSIWVKYFKLDNNGFQ